MANTTIYAYGSGGSAPVIDYNIPIVEVLSTGDVTLELLANTFYKFGTIDSLTITLASINSPNDGTTRLGAYGGKFTIDSNSTSASLLTVPASVSLFPKSDTISVGYTYEFNIVDNVAIVVKV